MRVLRRVGLPTVLLFCACASPLDATASEPNPNGTPYSRGVNAYFSGDLAAAESQFAEAIGVDPQDPRPLYFRALCRLREGRRSEARDDFLIAATLEARARGSYPVGKSLERVQGSDRLVLEQYRWQARPLATESRGNLASTPTESSQVAVYTDAGALRQAVSVPLDRLVQPVGLAELRAAIEDDLPPGSAMISDQSDLAGAAAAANPFADDPHSAAVGKLTSGKLMGIVGRAILQSAPVPSLEGLRDQIPGLPQPAENDMDFGADDDFGATITDDASADDPFSESSTPAFEPAAEPTDEESTTESIDEDPFG